MEEANWGVLIAIEIIVIIILFGYIWISTARRGK